MNRLVVATMLGSAFIAAPAVAQSFNAGMAAVCRMIPCVYDSQNTVVGVPQVENFIFRRVNGTWYEFNFDQRGPFQDVSLLYESNNCTGQPYTFISESAPTYMEYDGKSFWTGVGEEVQITYHSYIYGVQVKDGGPCNNSFYCNGQPNCTTTIAKPAAIVETRTFHPPFKMQ